MSTRSTVITFGVLHESSRLSNEATRHLLLSLLKDGTRVTIRAMPWISERIAPLHSFTKCAKFLVGLLPKKKGTPSKAIMVTLPPNTKKVYSNLWPCKVQFRMPHPVTEDESDKDKCVDAEMSLRMEPNVFVQPYSMVALPKYIRESLDRDGGLWLPAKRLKAWREDLYELGMPPEDFDKAFQRASNDGDTVGILPADAIEEGCLLEEKYRANSRNGFELRDGAIRINSALTDEAISQPSPSRRSIPNEIAVQSKMA